MSSLSKSDLNTFFGDRIYGAKPVPIDRCQDSVGLRAEIADGSLKVSRKPDASAAEADDRRALEMIRPGPTYRCSTRVRADTSSWSYLRRTLEFHILCGGAYPPRTAMVSFNCFGEYSSSASSSSGKFEIIGLIRGDQRRFGPV
ncbi:MAG: hypothetical protein IPM25_20255 [Chloracidobacterium sp.]|nr:hypothetical protein [Chloracidobacterium sp.]